MNSPRPSRNDAWALMRDAGCPDWVLRHVACVEGLAVAMARAANQNGHHVDEELVQVGAVLHDLGRSITQEPKHAHLGAERLRQNGMDDRLVAIVEHHTGAGVTADEAASIGVPAKDYTPQTLEEQIVAHADNLYSADRRLTLDEVRSKYDAKGLPEAFARIHALHRHLCQVCGTDLETLSPVELPTS